MSDFKIVLTVVPHGKADLVSAAAVAAGCAGGTVVMGRGIAKNAVIAALGIGDTTKDVLIVLSPSSDYRKIYDAIVESCAKKPREFGEIFVLDSECMLKSGVVTSGNEKSGGKAMAERSLITIILNKGYADDAMAAARKAGAGGGTVINARGTAREDDAKFFGIHIVPEKEMLMIVVENEKKGAVLEAVRTLPCLSQPGSGIAFCSDVGDFSLLGKK